MTRFRANKYCYMQRPSARGCNPKRYRWYSKLDNDGSRTRSINFNNATRREDRHKRFDENSTCVRLSKSAIAIYHDNAFLFHIYPRANASSHPRDILRERLNANSKDLAKSASSKVLFNGFINRMINVVTCHYKCQLLRPDEARISLVSPVQCFQRLTL